MELFFGTFPDFVKNGAPHESVANSDWIEGRAPRKSTNEPSKIKEKKAGKRRRTNNGFWVGLGSMMEGFGDHFESQHAFANRVKFWMRFCRRGGADFCWVGRAVCAGTRNRGEDNGGVQRTSKNAREETRTRPKRSSRAVSHAVLGGAADRSAHSAGPS